MKLRDPFTNFFKFYMKIRSVNNKYLKILVIQSKEYFKNIHNNLINNSLQIILIKKKYNKL